MHDYAATLKPTAVMVVQNGEVIANWGEVSRKVNVASVHKSLLTALYCIAVSEGRIDLGSTLADLGMDDKPPVLTGAEKQATVRDLLMARSGIYHAAVYETADIRQKRPERESHAPGTFWFYNNWDFDALGTIYRQQARTFSKASRNASQSPSASKISQPGTVDTWPNVRKSIPPIRFASVPGMQPALASSISMEGAGTGGRSSRRHG